VPNEAAYFALRAAVRELRHLVDNGMTQDQFELTKTFLGKYCLHYAPTTSAKLGYKLDDRFYGIDDHLSALPKEIASLSLEEVNAAIKRHLRYDGLKIVMITKNAEVLKKALVADKPSPMRYATPKPPSVVEEDKEIEKFPLGIREEAVTVMNTDGMFVK